MVEALDKMKLSGIPKVGVVAREVMEMELGIGLGRGLSVKQDSDLGFSRPKTSLKYLGSLFFCCKIESPYISVFCFSWS